MSSFILRLFAACTDRKTLYVAEFWMTPPPVDLRRYLAGNPSEIAAQSIVMFYSSVWLGETAKLNAGELKDAANMSAITLVTAT